jgi:TonB family protein
VRTRPTPLPSTLQCISFPKEPVNLYALGSVVLEFKIAVDGTVRDVHVAQSSGSDAYDASMVECASHRRYTPATENGQPVEVPWRVIFNSKVNAPSH